MPTKIKQRHHNCTLRHTCGIREINGYGRLHGPPFVRTDPASVKNAFALSECLRALFAENSAGFMSPMRAGGESDGP